MNSNAVTTSTTTVTLDNATENNPLVYMASEKADFGDASWTLYTASLSYTFSGSAITRTVHFKTWNLAGVSYVVSDTIYLGPETVPVPSGTFPMGRTAAGDDATYGLDDELPVHDVTLSAYQFGKYEVTNRQYCDVLNWALAQGLPYSDAAGTAWTGTGGIYGGGTVDSRYALVGFSSPDCNIRYIGGAFVPMVRSGLPGRRCGCPYHQVKSANTISDKIKKSEIWQVVLQKRDKAHASRQFLCFSEYCFFHG